MPEQPQANGLALQAYHGVHNTFPPGRDAQRGFNHSWTTAILPQLEQHALFARYDYSKPWYDGALIPTKTADPNLPIARPGTNAAVAATVLEVFSCPTGENWPGCIDYGGNYGSVLTGLPRGFGRDQAWASGVLVALHVAKYPDSRRKPVALPDVRDGASNTFLVLEDEDRKARDDGLWASGNNCFAHDIGPINTLQSNEIFSFHPGGAHGLMTDGAVRFLRQDMALDVIGAHSTRGRGDGP